MSEIQFDLFGDDGSKQDPAPARKLTWRDKYNQVIASPRWKKLRQKFADRTNSTCQRCKWKKEIWDKGRTLDLHHKTYERLGNERDSDLQLLCSHCHTKADIERTIKNREEGEARRHARLEDTRFDGWARKVYGDEYDDFDGNKHEKYIDWVERQGW